MLRVRIENYSLIEDEYVKMERTEDCHLASGADF